MNQEIYEEPFRALSARVIVALQYLEIGNNQEAIKTLKQVQRVLPVPLERHLIAAKNAKLQQNDC